MPGQEHVCQSCQRNHNQDIASVITARGLSFFLAFLVLVTIVVPMITLSRYGRIGLGLMFALMLFSSAVASIRTECRIARDSARFVEQETVGGC